MKDAAARQSKIEAMRVVGDQIAELDKQVAEVETQLSDLTSALPNIPDARTPYGKDDPLLPARNQHEGRKELSKRFFILLYLFLTRRYDKIELVFIRHHTQAQEVDEEAFFHARETGGTVVSSALVLMEEIIRARFNLAEWNIYGAQASDGDNWHHDSGRCRELLADKLLPLVRYYAYVQVAEEEQNLWQEYGHLTETHGHFAMRKATEASQIYPVFRDLFRKEGAEAA